MSDATKKWYMKTGWIIALLILFFPVGIFLMWKYGKTWPVWAKVVVSVFFGLVLIGAFSREDPYEANIKKAEEELRIAQENVMLAQEEVKRTDEVMNQAQKDMATADLNSREEQQILNNMQGGATLKKVGDSFSPDGKLEITVKNIQDRSQVGSQYFNSTPAEGGTYIVVDWSYKNISDKPVSSSPQIKLVSPSGVEYASDISASGYYATETNLDRKILSNLNPGITVQDANVFEVSKDLISEPGWTIQIKSSGKTEKVNYN